jgi:hypothetical protein
MATKKTEPAAAAAKSTTEVKRDPNRPDLDGVTENYIVVFSVDASNGAGVREIAVDADDEIEARELAMKHERAEGCTYVGVRRNGMRGAGF